MNRAEAKTITECEMTASEVQLRAKCIKLDDLRAGNITTESQIFLDCLKKIKLQMFLRGYETAVRDFGIYKDGVQKIGCLETPIKEIIERLYK